MTSANTEREKLPRFEYPDPVVAEFLRRVRMLSLAERKVVEGKQSRWPRASRRVGWRLRLLTALFRARPVSAFNRWLDASLTIRSSMGFCESEAALREYKSFWRELRGAGWTHSGLSEVARSLRAVRRRIRFDGSIPHYGWRLADVISPTSIGWPEGEGPIEERRREREEFRKLIKERPLDREGWLLHAAKMRAHLEELKPPPPLPPRKVWRRAT